MKEGRKVIIPTKRQIEAMERKQAEANVIIDAKGRTGMVNTMAEVPAIEAYLRSIGLSKKKQQEILENGRATDDFIDINIVRILNNIKDGKTKNERDDKDFKFSLEKLKQRWANSDVEMMAAFDKHGHFLGFETQNDAGKVTMKTGAGQLVGGTTIHSHPSEKGKFFGESFSVPDWRAFRDSGERQMVVTAKEGVFILEKSGPINVTNSQINKSWVKTTIRSVLSKRNIKDDKMTKFGCSKSELAVWRDLHTGNKELAAQIGVSYRFIPNKGFEGIDK